MRLKIGLVVAMLWVLVGLRGVGEVGAVAIGGCKTCCDACVDADQECTMQICPQATGDEDLTRECRVANGSCQWVSLVTPTLTPTLTPTATPTPLCKWCGDKCISASLDIMCTMQAPPVGASCKTLGTSGNLGCGIFYDGGSLPVLSPGCQYIRPETCSKDQKEGCEYQLDCSQKNEVCPAGKPSRSQGNADCDGAVGLMDYATWYAEYLAYLSDGIIRSDWKADFDFNGKVDVQDFSIWYASYVDGLNGSLTPMPTQTSACNVTPGAGCQLQQAGCLSSLCCPVEVCVAPTFIPPPTEIPTVVATPAP